MNRLLPLIALLPLAGCGALPTPPVAVLPPDAVSGAGDPTRGAIFNTAWAFGTPARLVGRPADAARAAAEFEHLAVEIPTGPRWRELSPALSRQFREGRVELRSVLGFSEEMPPQEAIDRLFAASRAFRVGDVAAAERAVGSEAAARLVALPAMPRVNIAAANTAAELNRVGRDGDRRRGGFRF